MYNHNMIFYDFDVRNLVNIKEDGTDGVPPINFSIGARYEDDIACCKIFNDGRLYVNSYAQPSIAMNGDLSMTGWTYKDEDGTEKKVSESQRSQMALVVTRPNDSEELAEAAESKAGAAAVQATTYEIDLNICGKIVQIPNGSYMKLNLGIPDGFEDLAANGDVKFKLYHFKRGEDGTIDYSKTEEIECVFTPYGIIAEVSSFSPYVLVAVDNSKLLEEERDTSKGVALMFNGHGGKVEGSISAAGTLREGEAAVYTLTPDAGYEVEFATLNGTPVTVADNTITLAYDELENSSNTLEVGFVATSVKEAEEGDKIDNVNPGVAAGCTKTEGCILPNGHEGNCIVTYTVTFQSNGGSEVAAANVESGAAVPEPEAPTRSGYSFAGWYADQAMTQEYDFSAPVAADITLYAKWTENSSGSTTPVPPTVPAKPDAPDDQPAWENPFADVAENDWYYSAVAFAVDNGLFRGTGETAFTPGGDMTRGMLATVLYRLAKEPETAADQSFSDVAGGQYYTEAVTWAADKGIVSGYGDGSFGPGDFITREQLAVMLWRYAGSPAGSGSLDSFSDGSQVSAWAADALQWAVEQKLVSGKGSGILDPGGKATRAEVAAILMRYCEIGK